MRKSVFCLAFLGLAASACSPMILTDAPDPVLSVIDLTALSEAIGSGRHGRIEAVIVEQEGRVLFEQYWRGTTAESRIDARSAGKSITSLAVGIAMDDGAIGSVDLRAFDVLADGKPLKDETAARRAITLHDLLSMSSALQCNDWVASSPGNEERMYETANWAQFALNIPVDPAYARNEQGQGRFSYCTAGVFLLGRVVEKKTGTRFDDYVQRRLFSPLGITGAVWTRSPAGEIQSGGQLSLRARDFQRIGRLVLDGGTVNGRQLISRKRLHAILTPRVAAAPGRSYGYLWWFRNFLRADKTEVSAAMMTGNGGNIVALFPQTDTVVTILATNYNRPDMVEQSASLIEDYIIPALPPGRKAPLFK